MPDHSGVGVPGDLVLPAFQDSEIDANGNPGILITGCPNCGKVHETFRGQRYLTIIGAAAIGNSGGRHPNDLCSRACRLQWEYAEQLHQQPEVRDA